MKRKSPMSVEVFNRLIEVGQNTNLTYKEIMAEVPVSKSQIMRTVYAGKMPKRTKINNNVLKMIEVAQDANLSYEEIMEKVPGLTYAQIQWAVYTERIPRRVKDNISKMIEVAQDANLSYEEIMEKVPGTTYQQIRWATRKGQVPKRCFNPDKLYDFRSAGGLQSALVRWGYNDDVI